MSKLEEEFLKSWKEHGIKGIPPPKRNYKFHPTRRFKFDFAFLSFRLAIEIDGFAFGKPCRLCKQPINGYHQTISGLISSADKQNLATELGWTVLRYTSSHLGSKAKRLIVVEQVNKIIIMLHEKK